MQKLLLFVLLALTSYLDLQALVIAEDLTKRMHVIPGQKIVNKILLQNNKDQPEKIVLSQTDYRYEANGQNFFEEINTLPRSNASWIYLPQREILLQPNESKEVYYTVQVPKDEAMHGSYNSAIFIEPESADEEITTPEQLNLIVKIRYAHQIITSIGKETVKLKISNPVIDNNHLSLDITNEGIFHAYPKMNLTIYNDKGLRIQSYEHKSQNILPGSSVRYTQNMQELDPGNYISFILLDAGNGQLLGEKLPFILH